MTRAVYWVPPLASSRVISAVMKLVGAGRQPPSRASVKMRRRCGSTIAFGIEGLDQLLPLVTKASSLSVRSFQSWR